MTKHKDKFNCDGCDEKLTWLDSARQDAKRKKEKIQQLNNYIGEMEMALAKHGENWKR